MVEVEGVNEVRLQGRLAAAAETKLLPSGDEMTTWRLVVSRPVSAARGSVDSIECATYRSKPKRTLAGAHPGDVLAVEGSLRRRFWRGPAGVANRYSVEVSHVRVVARRAKVNPGRSGGAARARTPASA